MPRYLAFDGLRLLRVALLAVATLEAGVVSALAEPAVRDITVTGLARVEAETVTSALTFKPGDTLTPEVVDRSLKKVFATGLFNDVRIDELAGRVTITVTEHPRISRLSFEGNSAIETKKLEPAITLKAGSPYTQAKVAVDVRAIRDLYRKEGRNTATVSPIVTNAGDGQIDLAFRISEGEINKVRHIAFSGNRAFTEAQLRDVVSTTESGWLDVLRSTVNYDKDRLARDRALLIDYYRRHGYPDATVAEPDGKLVEDKSFDVTFAIDEGERYTIAGARIDAEVQGLDVLHIERLLKVKAGEVYDAETIDASTSAIAQYLAASGQPFVRTAPRFERNEARKTITVVYTLKTGPPVYIRRIEISGNTRTRDHVIRRELKLAEGDPYNAATAELARKRVLKLGFFKTVTLAPSRTDNADKIDLKLAVEELDTGTLSFGIGYSEADGIIGDASYSDRNFLGTGRGIRVKIEAAERRYGGEIGLTEPHILGTEATGSATLFYRDTDRSLQSSFKEQRWGLSTKLVMQMSDTVSTSLNYSFTRSTLYGVGANASTAIKEAAGYPATSSTYDTSAVGYGVAYDTRDAKKAPTTGVYATATQDFAGIGGDARFVRSVADVRGYMPIADGLVLAGHMGGGTIAGYGGQDVRLLDLFYRGGETVRGFASSGIGPRDSLSANADALGGKSYYVTSVEMRKEIGAGLTGVAFVDAGSLFGTTKTSAALPGLTGNAAAPRVSAGVGLVWDSPIGGLPASYALPLLSQPGDKTQALGFGLTPGF